MSLTQVLPIVQALPRVDKLRLMQFLAAEIANEEGITLDITDKAFQIWSPYGAFEGAATLLGVLEEEKTAT